MESGERAKRNEKKTLLLSARRFWKASSLPCTAQTTFESAWEREEKGPLKEN